MFVLFVFLLKSILNTTVCSLPGWKYAIEMTLWSYKPETGVVTPKFVRSLASKHRFSNANGNQFNTHLQPTFLLQVLTYTFVVALGYGMSLFQRHSHFQTCLTKPYWQNQNKRGSSPEGWRKMVQVPVPYEMMT